jgi:TPR repeat protein
MNLTDIRGKAESGSTPAQTVLGICLLEGIDCAADHPEAFRWLSVASEAGASRAMAYLGTMYERGLVQDSPELEEARSYVEAHSGRE